MKLWLHFTILISINHLVKSWRPFNVLLTDVICFSNSSLVSHLNCSAGIDTNKGGISINFKVVEKLVKPTLGILLALRRINEPDFVLINTTSLNACNFFTNSNLMQILKLIRDEMNLYSKNFPKDCPLDKNTNFNINNYHFSADNLPSYVPECKFSLKVKFWSFKELLVDTLILGLVENKKRIKILKKKHEK